MTEHRSPEWLVAGTVGRPHGLDGSFYVEAPRPQMLRAGTSLLVDGRPARVARRAGTDTRPIVRLQGWDDRPAVERLRGERLLLARADAPSLGADEWWAEELEGCRVSDGDRQVGVVRRLVGLPSCEALEVECGDGDHLLVPLVADAVRKVDVEGGRIDVRLDFVEGAE